MLMWLAESHSFFLVIVFFLLFFAAQYLWLRKIELARRPWLAWFLALVLLFTGWFLSEQAGRNEKDRIRALSLNFARIYADQIETAGHWMLPSTAADDNPLYLSLIELQKRWLAMNPDAHDIYTLRKLPNGLNAFIVDSETDYNHDGKYSGQREERTRIGEVYETADPGLERAFRGEVNFEFTPITDRWGTWISAFVPLCNPAGEQEGVLGVDFDVKQMMTLVANAKLRVVLLTVMALTVLLTSSTLISILRAQIAKRRIVEASLQETSGLLETILKNSTDLVYFKDRMSRFEFYSQSFVNHCHLAHPDDRKGKTDFECFTEEHARPAFEAEQEIIRTGKPIINVEEKETHKDGRITWALTSKWPWYDKAGKIIGTWGISKDITKVRQTQEFLRLLNSAIDQATESFVITDADIDHPGPRILYANPAFTKMTGYSLEEVLGKTPRILQGPRSDRAVLTEVRRKLSRGEAFQGEIINYRKDGSEFEVEWEITPVRNKEGQVCHFIAVQRDIGNRKKFEAHLIEAQKLETVGRLAGGIAHEFNNIMTVIIGHSDWMLSSLPEDHPLRENADAVQKAAARAAALTRQLTAYGRKQLLRPEILDLDRVIRGMNEMFHHLLPTNVTLEISSCGNAPMVKADAGQLEQVIMNLVVNAFDAMPLGGTLSLTTSTFFQESAETELNLELLPGKYVQLSISDSGAGMTDAVKSRLFEPFFTTKDVGRGTGLGLAASYGIIKQSGGHIEVSSKIGKGSCFKIYLPLIEVAQPIAS